MKRKALSRRVAAKKFKRTARVNRKNITRAPSRGGIRL